MKISIIIPVYNVATYIERCLDSVIAQTYPDIECILVDDCGTDDSMEIAGEKIEHYSGPIEFKTVRHEKNRGLSAARNTGTDIATGEYVYYLDSDDLILPDTLELMAKPLETDRLDFVVGNYASGGDGMCFEPLHPPYRKSYLNREILGSYLSRQWYMMAWNKLVRREFLLEMGLMFEEGLLHEDKLWSFKLACHARSMGVVPAITYVYTLRQGSIMAKPNRERLDSLIRIVEAMEECVLKNGWVDDVEVCRYLTRQREMLVDQAATYGRKVAREVYARYVRKTSIFPAPQKTLSGLERIRYWHHGLPCALGYLYRGMLYRRFERFCLTVERIFGKVCCL